MSLVIKDKKTIKENLHKIKEYMKKDHVLAYVVFTSDKHSSEYISDYFKVREFLSGFTGSAGTLVITKNETVLFTDGRYFVQAEEELKDTDIILMRIGDKGVLTLNEYLEKVIIENKEDKSIMFDGEVVNLNEVLTIEKLSKKYEKNIIYDNNYIEKIWTDREKLEFTDIYHLEKQYTGKETKEKLSAINEYLENNNTDYIIITSLEENAWIFNLRANDIELNPMFYSFSIISKNEVVLFLNKDSLTKKAAAYLKAQEVKVEEYESLNNYIAKKKEELSKKVVHCDPKTLNYKLYIQLVETFSSVKLEQSPVVILKSIKNQVEIENLKKAHLKDGLAMVKFLYYLDNLELSKEEIKETDVAQKLYEIRQEEKSFIEESFSTIAAYNENAAMMHYEPSMKNHKLNPKGSILIDSGGQYLYGTTDITRTIALGEVSDEFKRHYTLVLKGMLNLSDAVFLKGCTGINLDILARGELWKEFIDYKCGTGHGVGYFSTVHEPPNGFRWKVTPLRNDSTEILPGMVTTNEPGVYIQDKYGIRIENELLCIAETENEYGEFLRFETLTIVPIDKRLVDLNVFDSKDKKRLNDYHEKVYNELSPYLEEDIKNWLKNSTSKI